MGGRLLVIDDNEASCRLVKAIFSSHGFDAITAATDGKSGLQSAKRDPPDIVILDLRLPDQSGLEVLEVLNATQPTVPVIMLTAHGDVKTAVRATQLGAFDYLTKPVDPEEIAVVVQRALEARALKNEVADLRRQLGDNGGLVEQMGPSREVARIAEQVRTVASTPFSVLILGETGTGKEVVAQAIHRQSGRRGRPFVAVDCGALPDSLIESELFGHEKGAFTGADKRKEGRFHVADGGTLLLDEVGNLPLGLQAKLLRVLESRQVTPIGATQGRTLDVRILAATNDDLQGRVNRGGFRADLFFRLAQYTLHLPPLRERTADIAPLAQRFLEEVSVELRRPVLRIAPDALRRLQRHRWPGNVRELRNLVRRAVLEADDVVLRDENVGALLGTEDPSATHAAGPTDGLSLREVADQAARAAEHHAICEVLRSTRGNKSQAAKQLRTDYKTLHTKMKSLNIRSTDFSR